MKIPWFEIINFALILVVLALLVRYLWDMMTGRQDRPEEWRSEAKKGRISKDLRKLERNYPDKVRFFSWWFQAERLKREGIPGAFAEVGVYKGDSALVLHRMDDGREFHLFDTFGGFPEGDLAGETGKAADYTTRNFSDTSVQKVKDRIGESDKFHFHPGHFPETAEGLAPVGFALVNIDADLYFPTRAALEFFYPRLVPGGVIFVHDYNPKWPGILKALQEFSRTIPEVPFIIPDMEGTAVIIRDRISKA